MSRYLDVSSNLLVGTIPQELSTLQSLEYVLIECPQDSDTPTCPTGSAVTVAGGGSFEVVHTALPVRLRVSDLRWHHDILALA